MVIRWFTDERKDAILSQVIFPISVLRLLIPVNSAKLPDPSQINSPYQSLVLSNGIINKWLGFPMCLFQMIGNILAFSFLSTLCHFMSF